MVTKIIERNISTISNKIVEDSSSAFIYLKPDALSEKNAWKIYESCLAIARPHHQIFLVLRDIHHFDRCSVGALIELQDKLNAEKKEMHLILLDVRWKIILELTNMEEYFDIWYPPIVLDNMP